MINDACGSRWFQIYNDNNDDCENECSSSALVDFALFHPKTSELPTRKFTKIVSFWKGELSSQKSLSSKSSSFSATQKYVSLPNIWHLLPTWEAKWHCLLHPWELGCDFTPAYPFLSFIVRSFIGDITTCITGTVGTSPGAMVARLPSAADVSDEVPQLHLGFQKKHRQKRQSCDFWQKVKLHETGKLPKHCGETSCILSYCILIFHNSLPSWQKVYSSWSHWLVQSKYFHCRLQHYVVLLLLCLDAWQLTGQGYTHRPIT